MIHYFSIYTCILLYYIKHHQISVTLNAVLYYCYYSLYVICVYYYVFIYFHYCKLLDPLNIYFYWYYTIMCLYRLYHLVIYTIR